jgi:serine/threonine-protein kinase
VGDSWQSHDALAKTDYGLPVSSHDLRAQSGSLVARWAEELVHRAKQLPKAWLFAVCGIVPLTVLVVILTVVFSSASRGAQTGHADGGAAASTTSFWARPTHASASQLSAAAAQGVPGLQTLAREFPTDPAVKKQLVTSLIDGGRTAEALRAIEDLAKLDKAAVDDAFVQFVAGATVHIETADEAFRLLEGPLGERGVDALYDLSNSKTATMLARNRAAKGLSQEDVKANASAATRVMLDLKGASTCTARRDWLQKAKQGADSRSLPTLKAMRNTRGCGFMGLKDCWPCIHKEDVDDAITAVEGRSGEARGAK